MRVCPNDQNVLDEIAAAGILTCAKCRGKAFSQHALDERFPGLRAALSPETDARCSAFDRTRLCPRCTAEMAPQRVDQQAVWMRRCLACDLYWIDVLERPIADALRRYLKIASRTVITEERADEIADDILSRDRADTQRGWLDELLDVLVR